MPDKAREGHRSVVRYQWGLQGGLELAHNSGFWTVAGVEVEPGLAEVPEEHLARARALVPARGQPF